jgi:23S rRNA pseudouridine2605 synthase
VGAHTGRQASDAAHRRPRGRRHVPRRVHPAPYRAGAGAAGRTGTAGSGRGRGGVPARLRPGPGDPGAARHRGPQGRPVRLTAGPAQGPGHADTGAARHTADRAGGGAGDRGERPGREAAAEARAPARRRARGVRRRPGPRSDALVLRGRGRVRHAVPDPEGRARGGGARHRVPGGGGRRPARGRRRLGRCAGRGRRQGDGHCRGRHRRGVRGPRRVRDPAHPGEGRSDGRVRPGMGGYAVVVGHVGGTADAAALPGSRSPAGGCRPPPVRPVGPPGGGGRGLPGLADCPRPGRGPAS